MLSTDLKITVEWRHRAASRARCQLLHPYMTASWASGTSFPRVNPFPLHQRPQARPTDHRGALLSATWAVGALPGRCAWDRAARVYKYTPTVAGGGVALYGLVEATLCALGDDHVVIFGLPGLLQGRLLLLVTG